MDGWMERDGERETERERRRERRGERERDGEREGFFPITKNLATKAPFTILCRLTRQ